MLHSCILVINLIFIKTNFHQSMPAYTTYKKFVVFDTIPILMPQFSFVVAVSGLLLQLSVGIHYFVYYLMNVERKNVESNFFQTFTFLINNLLP